MQDGDICLTKLLYSLNLANRHDCGQRRGANQTTGFIDRKTAIRIAIESQSKISAVLDNRLLQIPKVLHLQRVSLVVWEGAI